VQQEKRKIFVTIHLCRQNGAIVVPISDQPLNTRGFCSQNSLFGLPFSGSFIRKKN